MGIINDSTVTALEELEAQAIQSPLPFGKLSQGKFFAVIDMIGNSKFSNNHQGVERVKDYFEALNVDVADFQYRTKDGKTALDMLLLTQQEKGNTTLPNKELTRLVIEAGCPVSKKNFQQLTNLGYLSPGPSPIETAIETGRDAQIMAWDKHFPNYHTAQVLLESDSYIKQAEHHYKTPAPSDIDKFDLLTAYGAEQKKLQAIHSTEPTIANAIEEAHYNINCRVTELAKGISANELMSSRPNSTSDLMTDIVHGVAKGAVPAGVLNEVTATCKKTHMDGLLTQTYSEAMDSAALTPEEKKFLSITMEAANRITDAAAARTSHPSRSGSPSSRLHGDAKDVGRTVPLSEKGMVKA